MFSSLLFLRVGYVVGNAGLLVSFAQLVLAYSILVCTIMSISAIATNGSVESGGVYFMISRTLGPQLGGSVGILFYLANVVAGALYASGFSETLAKNFGPDGRITQLDFFDDDYYHSILLGVVSEVFTVWKFQNFSITQILREIKFWGLWKCKICHFNAFRCSNF